MGNTLLGISEVAKTLGVSHFTIRRLINAGEIKAVSIGTRGATATKAQDRLCYVPAEQSAPKSGQRSCDRLSTPRPKRAGRSPGSRFNL
jgi:excisionase family DNA binding protein